MEAQEYMDERLKEKPLLSLNELKEEYNHWDYKTQFTRNLVFLSSHVLPYHFTETKYSYDSDPDKRLPNDIKEYLQFTREFLNDKLQNWHPYYEETNPSGATGAAFAWLAGLGVIEKFPQFSTKSEGSLHNPYISCENGVNYAVFHCHIKTDKKSFGADAGYTTIKIKLDLDLLKQLDEEATTKKQYYSNLQEQRKKIGRVAKQIREFDERKQSESI